MQKVTMFTVIIMNNIPLSLFLGPIFLVLLFLICLVSVAGAKLLYYYFKQPRKKLKPKPEKVKSPRPKPEPVKSSRTVEINADEVDKIYVKRAS